MTIVCGGFSDRAAEAKISERGSKGLAPRQITSDVQTRRIPGLLGLRAWKTSDEVQGVESHLELRCRTQKATHIDRQHYDSDI